MMHAAVLILINLLAHFIPFERASLSLDDLSRLVSSEWSWRFFLKQIYSSFDYPLSIFHNIIVMFAGSDPFSRVLLSFLSSSLVTVAVYFLLKELLEDRRGAFMGALFYNLIPNKLALFHTLEYTYIHFACMLYLISFFCFVRFVKRGQVWLLCASLACYSVALFWYLLGFFLPVVLFAYALMTRPRKAWSPLIFIVPVAAYMSWRWNLFGMIPFEEAKPYDLQPHQTAANLFKMVPNLYLGRQMAKAVFYGIYRFFSLPFPWWQLFAVVDLGVLYALWRWLQKNTVSPLGRPILWLGVVSFFMLLAPALLTWGVMDRHTSLSSLGAVLILLWVISRSPHLQRAAVLSLIAGALMVSQGTAWSQVVACRMNQAIYQTLQERKQEILRADRVLIDQYSFSSQIPYTWTQDAHNQLDTYWGVQALLGRGNPLLVCWAVGEKKEVHVVRSFIQVTEKEFRFHIYNPDTYSLKEISVPRKGTVLIDYAKVYPYGFRNSTRSGFRQ